MSPEELLKELENTVGKSQTNLIPEPVVISALVNLFNRTQKQTYKLTKEGKPFEDLPTFGEKDAEKLIILEALSLFKNTVEKLEELLKL